MKIIPYLTDQKPIDDVGVIRIDLTSGPIMLYVSELGTRVGLRIEMENGGKQLSINPLTSRSIEVVVTEAGKEIRR